MWFGGFADFKDRIIQIKILVSMVLCWYFDPNDLRWSAKSWYFFMLQMFDDIRKLATLASVETTVLTSVTGQTSEPVGHLTGGLNWQYANIAYCGNVISPDTCWKEPTHDGGISS
jgi:hypothetical protein